NEEELENKEEAGNEELENEKESENEQDKMENKGETTDDEKDLDDDEMIKRDKILANMLRLRKLKLEKSSKKLKNDAKRRKDFSNAIRKIIIQIASSSKRSKDEILELLRGVIQVCKKKKSKPTLEVIAFGRKCLSRIGIQCLKDGDTAIIAFKEFQSALKKMGTDEQQVSLKNIIITNMANIVSKFTKSSDEKIRTEIIEILEKLIKSDKGWKLF